MPGPRRPSRTITIWSDSSTFTRSRRGSCPSSRNGLGFADVRVRGEELIANWFGWFNRGLEASADPDQVPVLWRQYAFHGYLLLQRLDERLLEPRLPAAVFYNLLLTGRRP